MARLARASVLEAATSLAMTTIESRFRRLVSFDFDEEDGSSVWLALLR
jgi:hypothetical protein